MASEALFTQGGNYDAQELRRLIAGIWSAPSPGGVISGATVTPASGLNVSVSAGYVFVYDAAGGAYLGYNTATVNLVISSNSGGTGTRSDTVQARINDPGSGLTAGELVYSVKTNSSTVDALSIPVATVSVTTSNVISITTPTRQVAEVQNIANRTSTTPSATGTYNATSTVFANLAARLANIETGIVSDAHTQYVHLTKAQVVTNKDLSSSSNVFPASLTGSGSGNTGGALLPGMMMMYGGPTAPTGWLLCAGQAVSRSTYSALFGVMGITYGVGDGVTTFTLPDLRGRVPAGADSMGGIGANRLQGTSGLPGAVSGTQNVALSATNLPAHTHAATVGVNSVGHTHAGPSHNHGGSTGADSPSHTHTVASHNHGGATGAQSATHYHDTPFQAQEDTTSGSGGIGWRVTDISNTTAGSGTTYTANSTANIGDHTHGIASQSPLTGGPSAAHAHSINTDAGVTGTESQTHTHAVTIGTTGSGTSFDIVQPTMQVNYIVKT